MRGLPTRARGKQRGSHPAQCGYVRYRVTEPLLLVYVVVYVWVWLMKIKLVPIRSHHVRVTPLIRAARRPREARGMREMKSHYRTRRDETSHHWTRRGRAARGEIYSNC